MAIREVLDRAGLGQYAGLFEAQHVDAELARSLDEADLKEIGVASLGHRRRLLAAFAAAADAAPVIERRGVVVLFADLVDSTRITRALDAEEAFDLLGAFFDLIDRETARAGGTVERHVGDAVMAVFGAPHAHGDEALRAVRMGHGLHARLAALGKARGLDLGLRVGIAAGPAIVRSGGAEPLSVVGASVNLAARLAATAAPGRTLVADDIRAACGAAVRTGHARRHALKGFDDEVTSWQVLGLDEGDGWTPIGRASERRFFDTVLNDLDAQGTGRLIVLRGEAGIGKTSLLSLWLGAARARGLATHTVRVLDFGTARGAAAVAGIAAALLPLADLPEGLRIWLDAMAGTPLPPDRAALIDAAAPEARAARQAEALRALVRGATRAAPLVIAFEDTHWADRQTLSLLSHLCRFAADMPLVVVATTRIEGDRLGGDWRAGLDSTPAWNVDLGPLSARECRLLARGIVGSDTGTDGAIAASRGHPLYLEQLLRHGMEDLASGVPQSIHTLIQARVDLLGQGDRRAARAASVLGQKVPPDALCALLGLPGYDPAALVDRRILQRDGDGLAFHHALIRDCVYATLLRDERAAFHRAAADWFAASDPALRAEHLARIDAPETAAAYLSAAEAAARAMNHADAMRLAGTGRAHAPDPETGLALLIRQARSAHEANRPDEAIALFDEAETAAGADAATRVRAQIGKVVAMRLIDRVDEAAAICRTAEAAARAGGLRAELSELLYLRGALLFPTGDFKGSLAAHHEALALAGDLDDPGLMAAALSGRGDALYAQGRMRSARRVFDDCLSLCAAHGLTRVRAANLFMRGTVRIYALDWTGALADARDSADLARAIGHSRAEIISRLTAGWVLAWTGRLDEAEDEVHRGLALVEATGARRFRPFLSETLGHVAYLRGEGARAVAVLSGALDEVRALGAERFIGPWVMGSLALALGPGAAQDALLAEAETLLATDAIGHNHYQFRRLALEAAIARCDPAAALAQAAALARFSRDEPTEWSAALTRRAEAAGPAAPPPAP